MHDDVREPASAASPRRSARTRAASSGPSAGVRRSSVAGRTVRCTASSCVEPPPEQQAAVEHQHRTVGRLRVRRARRAVAWRRPTASAGSGPSATNGSSTSRPSARRSSRSSRYASGSCRPCSNRTDAGPQEVVGVHARHRPARPRAAGSTRASASSPGRVGGAPSTSTRTRPGPLRATSRDQPVDEGVGGDGLDAHAAAGPRRAPRRSARARRSRPGPGPEKCRDRSSASMLPVNRRASCPPVRMVCVSSRCRHRAGHRAAPGVGHRRRAGRRVRPRRAGAGPAPPPPTASWASPAAPRPAASRPAPRARSSAGRTGSGRRRRWPGRGPGRCPPTASVTCRMPDPAVPEVGVLEQPDQLGAHRARRAPPSRGRARRCPAGRPRGGSSSRTASS